MKIRVLIVDDEPLARERLRTLLEAEPDLEIAGECGDGLAQPRRMVWATSTAVAEAFKRVGAIKVRVTS